MSKLSRGGKASSLSRNKNKILFCYFTAEGENYIPLDLGYILAIMKKEDPGIFKMHDIDFVSLEFPWFPVGSKEVGMDERLFLELEKIKRFDPDAVFFFLDNIRWSVVHAAGRSKKIARMLKESNPDIFIGMQSYKFHPDHSREILSDNLADCLIGTDPESSFVEMEKILRREKVNGVAYASGISEYESFLKTKKNDDLIENGNLDEIPSPYLSGIMDEMLRKEQARNDGKSAAVIYSSRGCPYRCYFCSRSVKYENLRFFSAKRFYDEIEYLFSKFGITNFAVFDDSFSCTSKRLGELREEFEKRKADNPRLSDIRLGIMARAESFSENGVFELLRSLNIQEVQIGIQTINPGLQHYMGRRIEIERFKHISDMLKKYGIRLILDIIMGLPGDTIDNFRQTLDFGLSLEFKRIRVKRFFLNPGTKFFLEKDKYGIIVNDEENDIYVPFVTRMNGDEGGSYWKESMRYSILRANDNPRVELRFSYGGSKFSR